MNAKRTITVMAMILLFGMISFVTNLAAPLGVVIREQFNVPSALGLMGNFVVYAAYALMGVPAGRILCRTGYKKTAVCAVIVGFAGVFIQFLSGQAGSFAIYLAGAFVSGFSMCMLNTVVNPMLNFLGGGEKRGNQLIQAGGTFNSLVGILVPVWVGNLVGEITKNTSIADVNIVLYIAMAAFLAAGLVLSLIKVEEPVSKKEGKAESPLKYRHFVLGCVAIFVYVGVEVGIPATMNFYLVDSGVPVAEAGTLVGTFYIMMLAGRVLGIPIAGRFSARQMLVAVSAVGCLLMLAAICLPERHVAFLWSGEIPVNAIFLILAGLCTSVMWGNIFNLAVNGLGASVSAASGIFMTMVCGGGILPFVQNLLSDAAGYLTSYWLVFAGMAYLLYYAVSGSRAIS